MPPIVQHERVRHREANWSFADTARALWGARPNGLYLTAPARPPSLAHARRSIYRGRLRKDDDEAGRRLSVRPSDRGVLGESEGWREIK